MIEAIEVVIHNGLLNEMIALISYKYKTCYINNKKYSVTDKFLDEFKSIILTWDNEYSRNEAIDEEEFFITVFFNNKEDKYHGKGVFPIGYSRIKELLGDLNGRKIN